MLDALWVGLGMDIQKAEVKDWLSFMNPSPFKRKWTDQKPTNNAKGASVSEQEAGPPEGLEPWD